MSTRQIMINKSHISPNVLPFGSKRHLFCYVDVGISVIYENRCQLMTFAPYALCRPQILILVFGVWSNTPSMAQERTCEYPTPHLLLFSFLFRMCVVFLMPEILLTKCLPTGISHTHKNSCLCNIINTKT